MRERESGTQREREKGEAGASKNIKCRSKAKYLAQTKYPCEGESKRMEEKQTKMEQKEPGNVQTMRMNEPAKYGQQKRWRRGRVGRDRHSKQCPLVEAEASVSAGSWQLAAGAWRSYPPASLAPHKRRTARLSELSH